jgi:8-oxo-dGTP pyrophosphatase MutT (NUDIX family)
VALVEQAGSIVVSTRGGAASILLITAKRNRNHWVFPKGHVDPGETFEQTALREAEEEAGIAGRIVCPAGTVEFALRRDIIRVHYFIVRTDDDGRPEAGRRLGWFSYEDALKTLSFENGRALLRQVAPLLEDRPPG